MVHWQSYAPGMKLFMSLSLLILISFSAFAEDQPALPTCPIGTDGAPNLKDPGIASGAQCRGACGENCPTDRCDQVDDITIPVSDSAGNQYNCVYRNVLNCLTHQGCVDHDACYDRCAEAGESSLYGSCHGRCNDECFERWGSAQCGAWADIAGYRGDYWINPDFDGVMLFSDPPELVGPVGSNSSYGIIGTWSWFTGETVEIRPDGTFSSEKNKGNWEFTDQSSRQYTMRWDEGGWIDSLTISAKGNSLSGQNQYGNSVTGTKV